MVRRRETSHLRSLVALACAAAAVSSGGVQAFVVVGGAGGSSSGSSLQQPHTAFHHYHRSSVVREAAAGGGGGGVDGLYTNEPADPNRRVLKLAFLAATRPKKAPKTEKEKSLDKHVWGRWKLVVRGLGGTTGGWGVRLGVGAVMCVGVVSVGMGRSRRSHDWGGNNK
jgi:hypothetical protein